MKSLLQRVFTDEEVIVFQTLLAQNDKLVLLICKILKTKLRGLERPTVLSDFESGSWALTRAYRDGGISQIKNLLQILGEKNGR